MSAKKAVKSIKAHIEAKEHEAAVYEATELLKSIDPKSPEAAQVLILRGLALTHTGKKDEAEKCYLHANKIQPGHPLAEHGLRQLYKKDEAWDKLARFLQDIVQASYEAGDAERCAASMNDLLEILSKHGPQDTLYRTLHLLLPTSPLAPLLQTAPLPQGSYTPFPCPIYPPKSFAVLPPLPSPLPHVLHLVSSLPLLLNLLIRSQGLVHQEVEAKVKAGRMRLGAGTEKEVRQRTEGEVLSGPLGSDMVELLREVAAHPGADEAVRRDVEVREFEYWRKLVSALSAAEKKQAKKPPAQAKSASVPAKPSIISSKPSMISSKPSMISSSGPPKPPPVDESLPPLFRANPVVKPTREEALSRTDGLAKGFVLLGVSSPGAEEAWTWVIEGKDEPTLYYDIELLHGFAKAFPDSLFTDFIDDYCRWFKLPLPEPEEEITEEVAKADPAKKTKRNKRGLNARERRKQRRLAGREGEISEDLEQEEKEELLAAMTKLLDQLPKSIFVHRVMARIAIEDEDWANAVSFAERGRVLVKALESERGTSLPLVQASLDTALGVALVPYYPPKHHIRAARLLTGVLSSDPSNAEARFSLAKIEQTAGKWAEARANFQKILDQGERVTSAKEEIGWCLVNEGQLEKGREILEEVVEERDTKWNDSGKEDEAFPRARAWWRLGRTEWLIDEKSPMAEDWFMASIRALPSFAPAYSSLGNCYLNATPPDAERALKCFQKAFELDATETEAARLLAEGYADDDEWALVRGIANRVMEGEGGVEGVAGGEALKGRFAPKNGWAWKALGATEMHYRQYAKAAEAYQIALRADPDDVSTWVQLGESYVRCGRHLAGLKALQHALDLDDSCWMALYDIGDVHLQLGAYDKAIDAFEQVLQITGLEQFGVIAKLGDTMISLGRHCIAGGFRERARNAFYRAITLAGDVLKANVGQRPWAWKIVGDATFELAGIEAVLAEAGETTDVTYPILHLLIEDDTDRRSTVAGLGHASNLLQSPVDLSTTLRSSVFAFAYRAHLLKNETRVADPALYDLASALHALSAKLEGEEKKASVKAAIGAIRLALERDAGDERLWNALGVICAQGGEEIAQHAFVVSLELYAKDPVVWTNLGYLYLKLEDNDLANQCFLKAQVLDPDCSKAWLGQGLLAEKAGDREHAKALFAHAVTLSAGALLEADLAQAVSAFLPLVNVPTDNSLLHAPTFALRHYTHVRPRDASALHLFALLCERLGLIDEAAKSLSTAVTLLEEEFENTESAAVEKAYCVALLNLGRVRLAAGEYTQALESLSSVWELVESAPEDEGGLTKRLKLQSRLGKALAKYWIGDVDSSLEEFQASLDLATGRISDEVAVLLARTLWGLGGEDAREAAKTHLMESLSSDAPPVKVVNALAAIALVSSDEDLLEAAISELQAIPAERIAKEDTEGHVALVLSTEALVEGNIPAAVDTLSHALIDKPGDLFTRNRLAKLLIASGRPEEAVVLYDPPGAEEGVRSKPAVEKKDAVLESQALVLKGLARLSSGEEGGLSDIHAGVRVCPWSQEAWTALAWARKVLDELEGEEGAVEQGEQGEGEEIKE